MNGEPHKWGYYPFYPSPKGKFVWYYIELPIWKRKYFKKEKDGGLERSFSHKECLLSCQRIGVWFPESTSGDSDLSPALGTLTPSSGLRGTHMHMHIHTGKHTHRYKNESLRKGKKITV